MCAFEKGKLWEEEEKGLWYNLFSRKSLTESKGLNEEESEEENTQPPARKGLEKKRKNPGKHRERRNKIRSPNQLSKQKSSCGHQWWRWKKTPHWCPKAHNSFFAQTSPHKNWAEAAGSPEPHFLDGQRKRRGGLIFPFAPRWMERRKIDRDLRQHLLCEQRGAPQSTITW